MQMMRARCAACGWVFDVAALPGPILDVAKAMQGRCVCPLCYAGGATVADPRPLTDAEHAAKGLGPLGAAVPATIEPPVPETERRTHTLDDEAAFWRRHEADGAVQMDAKAWGDWVDNLPRNEFLAMLHLGIKARQEPADA